MIRTLSLVAALALSVVVAAPALAQAPKLPAGADPQNTTGRSTPPRAASSSSCAPIWRPSMPSG